jgi:hypothetical protein
MIDELNMLIPEDSPPLFDNEDFTVDCLETCLQLMHSYVEEDPLVISDPDFKELLLDEVKGLFVESLEETGGPYWYDKECWAEELDDFLEVVYELFSDQIMPQTSCVSDAIDPNYGKISEKLKKLDSKPKHEQRTKAWYEYRYNLITASSAHKAFDSQSSKNQLIYEKCQPLIVEDNSGSGSVNLSSPLHWGQKYEPVSTLLYEDMFSTKVSEYGCIQHETYKFLGASPDGIMTNPLLPRYGRMLEIKNIVNREITGIPKREYWIQMQLQMETCDLDECDFLETKFVEYQSYSESSKDGTFLKSEKGEKKGVILYFSNRQGRPMYIYKPLQMDQQEFDETWEQEQMALYEKQGFTWIKNIYWRLEKLSCVLVMRNKEWFQCNIPILAEVWSIIEKERVIGSEHRAPKKRSGSFDKTVQPSSTGCLISRKVNPVTVIKIRTESIDETKEGLDLTS